MHRIKWVLVAGAIFALAAIIAAPLAGLQLAGAFNVDGQVSWFSLILGVFVTGSLVWWLLRVEEHGNTLLRGAVAGIFVAVLSYPVVVIVSQILHRNWHLIVTPLAALDQLFTDLLLSFVALVSTGPAAIVVMAAAGALAAAFPKWLSRREAAERPKRGAVDLVLWLGGTVAIGTLAILSLALLWLTLIPLDSRQLRNHVPAVQPATTYEAALALFAEVQATEAKLPLNPVCKSALRTHGQKVAKVVVFYHGLTNCPAQGVELADQLFAQGYNVYMPRLPEHGMQDVMTEALSQLTAEQMVATDDTSVAIASGLGDEVLVFGLSAGGTLTTWTAQTRSDVDKAIPISPFLGAYVIPAWATRAATNLLLILPNTMVWWDDTHAEPAGMDYAYPRFATHGLAQMMRLGFIIEDIAKDKAPAATNVAMLLNAADNAVNNAVTDGLIKTWEAHGKTVAVTTLPKADGLPHDVIDPHQPLGNTKVVYPTIIEMLGR
ncbi:MAG: alpha/beta hydrolase [Devosia sp.]